jgi:hypothetical protein
MFGTISAVNAVSRAIPVTGTRTADVQAKKVEEVQLAAALQAVQDINALVPVVAVRIRHVEMAPRFAGERLTIHTKYGNRGKCLRCSIARFSPEAPVWPKVSRLTHRRPSAYAHTQLGSTCLFLLNDHVDPVIRFSVRKGGLTGRSVAKTSIPLAVLSQASATDLPLHSRLFKEPLGRVSVACELMEVSAQYLLSTLADACADKQKDACLISGSVPTVPGECLAQGSSDGDSSDGSCRIDDTSQAPPTAPLLGRRIA